MNRFFDQLEEILGKHELSGSRIFNMDESGISTVQRPPRIIAEKGKRTVGIVTSAERGVTVTMVACMSAAGQFVPPQLIFPRKNFTDLLLTNAPIGTLGTCSENGWTNSDLFLVWLKHFVVHVKPTKEEPVLLILDNHASHISLQGLNYARDRGVIMLSLPPHCSHKIQPLDRAFFKSLKELYHRQCQSWMSCNPGKRITIYQVSSLLAPAYARSASVASATKGFACTGIFPFNRDIFSEDDFMAAENLLSGSADQSKEAQCTAQSSSAQAVESACESQTNPGQVALHEISPLPKPTHNEHKNQRKRRCQRSEVLTSTPIKLRLEEKATLNKKVQPQKKKATTRKITLEHRPTPPTKEKESESRQSTSTGSSQEDPPEVWYCLVCDEKYVDPPTETWIMCNTCLKWCHEGSLCGHHP